MPLPFENKIKYTSIYCCLVAIISIILFSLLVGIFGLVVSWIIQNNEATKTLNKVPSWQNIWLVGTVLFLLSNLCLYYSELIVESFVDKVKLSRFGTALLVFVTIFFVSIWLYFGFGNYIGWFRQF
jgi:hypothetical protein